MSKRQIEQKLRNYSILKNSLRFITLGIAIIAMVISIWGLSLAYQLKKDIEWVNSKQDNVIETMMFRDINKEKIKNND